VRPKELAEDRCYPFDGKVPRVAPDAFIAPTAALIGDVRLGARSSVWFGAALRADGGPIRVGDEVSVQDNAVLHAGGGPGVTIGDRVTIGHGAIIHDCAIESDVLIGMGAVVLDGAHVGRGSLVAAGSVVLERTVVPPGRVARGTPAVIGPELREGARDLAAAATADYLDLTRRYRRDFIA
jgi:carbonic anhydrase/acetyltransferase-like protein (isoleucine patch superfamily)